MLNGEVFKSQEGSPLLSNISETDFRRQIRTCYMLGSTIHGETIHENKQVYCLSQNERLYKITGWPESTHVTTIEGLVLSRDRKRIFSLMETLEISADGKITSGGIEIPFEDPGLSFLKSDLHTGFDLPPDYFDQLMHTAQIAVDQTF